MKNNYTEIVFLLDRSGSMESIQSDVIGGFNKFIAEQKKLPGDCKVSLYQFDDRYETSYENMDIQFVPDLNEKTFIPRGWTALLDGIGKTINTLGERLSKMDENSRPSKVILCIQTDGEENASKEFDINKIREMITHQKEKYSWNILFLGANIDAISVGGNLGLSKVGTLTYTASAKGTKMMYNSLSRAVSSCRLGDTQDCAFTQEDRDDQE